MIVLGAGRVDLVAPSDLACASTMDGSSRPLARSLGIEPLLRHQPFVTSRLASLGAAGVKRGAEHGGGV